MASIHTHMNIKPIPGVDKVNTLARFRLWQLISPALPIGGYAYSQGLEYVVEAGWIKTEQEMQDWLAGMISSLHVQLDLPVLIRMHHSWLVNDLNTVHHWNNFLLASRETSELVLEDCQLGRALVVLLKSLDCRLAPTLAQDEVTLASALSAAGAEWGIPVAELAQAYLWIWTENQVAAAIKLIPLGQTAGQKILYASAGILAEAVISAMQVADEDIGQAAMALAIASSRHETQYTRIFRS